MKLRFARAAAWLARIAAATLAFAWLPAHATSVLPAYLEELVDHSTVAFEGTVTANRTERDTVTNFIVTYTTFEVTDALKGPVGTTYEIKQVGGKLPDGSSYKVDGVPRFTVGQDYVVFLAGVSSLGFSSPIALSQGSFTVHSRNGAKVVANGRDFREMMSRIQSRLPAAARTKLNGKGPVREWDLDDFKRIVRSHMAGAL